MAVILDVTSTPQNFTDGNWPRSHFNTGKWRFTMTPTHASGNSAYDSFRGLMGRPTGGLWINDRALELYDDADNLAFSRAMTWSALQAITITVDIPAGEVTISGASTGDGTFSFTDIGPYFTQGTLSIGSFDGTNLGFAGTISDFDDTVEASVGTASGTSSVAGVGAADVRGAGSSSGAATVAGVGASAAVADGTAAGVAAASAVGASEAVATGTSAGTSTADGVASEPDTAVGTADGTSSAAAVGASDARATGTSEGLGAAAAVGASDAVATGTAAGTSSAAAIASGSVGTAAGTSSAAAVGASDAVAAGSSVGAAIVAGVGASAAVATGTAAGTSLATGVSPGGLALGEHASVSQEFGASSGGEIETPAIATTNGSCVVLSVGRQVDVGAPFGELGGSADGNTFAQIGTDLVFEDFTNYETALYRAFDIAGGADHTFHLDIEEFDEGAVIAVEVVGGSRIVDSAQSQEDAASVVTSPSVTTTGPAILLSFWWGTGADITEDMVATVSAGSGWTRIEHQGEMYQPNGAFACAAAYKEVGAAGVHTGCPWEGRMGAGLATPQGAHLYTVAIQGSFEYGTGATAGSSNAAAVGASDAVADGSASGTSTVAATGASDAVAAGSAAGVGSAAAVGASETVTTGEAAGGATAAGVGAASTVGAGASAGAGAAAAVGAADAVATGTAAGISSAEGAGDTGDEVATGTAAGTSSTAGVGSSEAVATGAAAGTSAAAAVPASQVSPRNATAQLATPTVGAELATPTITARWE